MSRGKVRTMVSNYIAGGFRPEAELPAATDVEDGTIIEIRGHYFQTVRLSKDPTWRELVPISQTDYAARVERRKSNLILFAAITLAGLLLAWIGIATDLLLLMGIGTIAGVFFGWQYLKEHGSLMRLIVVVDDEETEVTS